MINNPNLLFVYSRNQWRSPTAENIYRRKGYKARSAGTSSSARTTISRADIKWADLIFVMEKKHKNRIVAEFSGLLENKTIYVLEIPDDYKYMDEELVSFIEDTVESYLSLPTWLS